MLLVYNHGYEHDCPIDPHRDPNGKNRRTLYLGVRTTCFGCATSVYNLEFVSWNKTSKSIGKKEKEKRRKIMLNASI